MSDSNEKKYLSQQNKDELYESAKGYKEQAEAAEERANELEERLAAVEDAQPSQSVEDLQKQLAELRQAFIAVQTGQEDEEEETVTVVCTGISGVSIPVQESNGRKRTIQLPREGDSAKLTKDQFRDLPDVMIEEGYLRIEGEALTPNQVSDPDAFIADVEIDDIPAAVQEIDTRATLFTLHRKLEARRLSVVGEGEDAEIKVTQLPGKLEVLRSALVERIQETANVQMTAG